jgi:dihydroorotate dehydrogenase (NAD+) catalytic subunit
VTIAGVRFKNPVIAASGTFGYGREYADIFDVSLLGGICTKGLTLEPRAGNSGERLYETPSGLMNSIGLENPGIPYFLEHHLPYLKTLNTAIIANLSGGSVEEYTKGAELLSASTVDMVELNISCPNVKSGGMSFGLTIEDADPVVRAVRKVCKKPLMVKLSPNAPDLAGLALGCVNLGADSLSLVNTFKAMVFDTATGKPFFDNGHAGLSGPAIRPIAVRMVWEVAEAIKKLAKPVPIVGLGGIQNTDDALQFLLAGATAVQIGTSTFARPRCMLEIIQGLKTTNLTNHTN